MGKTLVRYDQQGIKLMKQAKIGMVSTLKKAFRKASTWFLDTLFPERITCALCRTDLKEQKEFLLCSDCFLDLPFVDKGCKRCGKPIYDEATHCLECQNHKRYFACASAPLIYEGNAERLVANLKYFKQKYVAESLGGLAAVGYVDKKFKCDIIVPVPKYNADSKKLEFNHAFYIAERVSALVNVPLFDDILFKIKETPNQMGLSGNRRRKNLKDAFDVPKHKRAEIKDKTILVVDDVITTGSTLNECAKALLLRGAKAVYASGVCVAEYHRDIKNT